MEGRLFRFDYTYYPNIYGWLKLHVIPATWRDAWLICDLEGSNTTQWAFYTGVHAIFSKGYFFSIEGVSLSKMPVRWAAGEPDNVNNHEDCIVWTDGRVADVNCSKLFPYMCFKRKTKDMVMTSCGTVDKDYELSPLTGNCYKFHRHERTWHRAHMTCAAEGGYLAVINSQEEALILKKIFDKNYSKNFPGSYTNQIHIGMHDWDDPGVWRTIHGLKIEEAGYAKWSSKQPNNVEPGQHCGSMFNTTKLNDFWCDRLAPFICEKSPNSLLDDGISE
ncbi:hemolymph lipopolysaccharide-binding protein-like [Melitaea cinxia]|uniref:hemolymph lipopolysaccharide-binding protein-like n=1 Tax=Melitaea cinxia TaxID=113334 RepID=UPI001E270591|nr:hemolymph lipopolysaccharide-binding protein-like [Melitaea cinxia]